ncbi:MAG TPA: ubiquinol oxidase subunit II [Steroidobacteraceae bacterium]|nr:ubiquinol oxidase subunit II [Steroidobacteraceae bacterium]
MMDRPARRRIARLLPLPAALLLSGCQWAVLDPKGPVGLQERSIILTATVLMLIVVVPVIALILGFAWRYRASNEKAEYRPDWSHSGRIEAVVWLIPCTIIAALGVITWRSSHSLDPYRPLTSRVKPIRIDAVALDWKWLFIYPDQQVATVNEVAFPANVPVEFHITSATVMNAFFIPQLGSQIYAMAGMQTQLHLLASEPGTYQGLSSNYSGDGFSGMTFEAIAEPSRQGFDAWLAKVRASRQTLGARDYMRLARPSESHPVTYYSQVQADLFADIVAGRLQEPTGRLVAHTAAHRQVDGPTAAMGGMSGMSGMPVTRSN